MSNPILETITEELERESSNLDSLDNLDIMSECPICLESLFEKQDYTITKCLHKFHNSCIIKHIHRVNHNCPVCREEILTVTMNLNILETRIRTRIINNTNNEPRTLDVYTWMLERAREQANSELRFGYPYNDPPDTTMIKRFLLQITGFFKFIMIYTGIISIIYRCIYRPNILDNITTCLLILGLGLYVLSGRFFKIN